jgi:hypothetical protein
MTGARKYNNERETAKKGLCKNLLVQNILTVFFINIKSFTIDFKHNYQIPILIELCSTLQIEIYKIHLI